MALPKLNNTPMYDVVIPSLNKKTRFRPYLVGEEKVLLMAAESDDANQITRATLDLIEACLEDDIDAKKLSAFDTEYLFLKIRSKSVGETTDLVFTCANADCEHENEVTINLNDIIVDNVESATSIIELTPAVSLEMRYISYYDTLNIPGIAEAEDDVTRLYHIILNSIEAVLTEEERLNTKEEPQEELEAFIDNMTTSQFEKLRNFVLNTPDIKLDVVYKCESCDNDNRTTLRGLASFFE